MVLDNRKTGFIASAGIPSAAFGCARIVLVLAAAGVVALPLRAAEPPGPSAQSVSCAFDGENRAWTQRALRDWQRVNRHALKIVDPAPPSMVLFDTTCSYELKPAPADAAGDIVVSGAFRYSVSGAAHGGSLALADGQRVPARLTSFAMPLPDGTMSFVMALPPIWEAQAKGDDRVRLATAVFMHEFTHTQSAAFGRKVDALAKKGLPPDSDDDVVQTRFASRPGFAAAIKREQELLWEAAAAPTIKDARALTRRALRVIDSRRARYFTGKDAVYAEAEELFLTLEGTGQYALYRWLTDPKGGAMDKREALAFARRDGRHWSQEEGLAIYLVLDRLWVDWQPSAFGPASQTGVEALRATVEPRPVKR